MKSEQQYKEEYNELLDALMAYIKKVHTVRVPQAMLDRLTTALEKLNPDTNK